MDVKLNQSVMLKLSKLEANKGQIEGLPKNPRIIKDDKFRKLVKSIEDNPEMTSLREILVYPHEGKYVVIGGNMRLKAMKELGYKEAPCKIIPEETTVEQLRAYTIKDNSGFGEWDFDMLASEWDLNLLEDCAIEMPEVDSDAPVIEEAEAEEDDFDEENDEVERRVKRGDIWRLGDHRLMCGDSKDNYALKTLMGGARADITFSSPPYNMMASGIDNALKSDKVKASYNIVNGTYNEFSDNLTNDDYSDLLKKTLKNGLDNSDDVLFNIGILSGSKTGIIEMLHEFKSKFLDILVWNKNNSIPLSMKSNKGMVSHRCELIFCFNQKGNRSFSHPQFDKGVFKGEAIHNRIDSKNASSNEYAKIHHATFPVEFAYQVLERFTDKSVIDLFGGTGTTMIAAEQLKRKCYMMELDPHYCDVIIARWEKLTGKKAVKIN